MRWTFENAKIKGRIVLTDSLHEDPDLLKDKTLYKFIWVDSGEVELDIDHQQLVLKKGQLIPLSHLHHLEFLRIEANTMLCCSTETFTAYMAMTMKCRVTGYCFTVRRMC